MTERKYGIVELDDCSKLNEGYTLAEVIQLSQDMHEGKQSLCTLVCDIAVEADLLVDLADHITELQEQNKLDHEQAGITINYEMSNMQSVGMAHGMMAALIQVKNILDIESEKFKEFEAYAQAQIAQCVATLLHHGLDMETINKRIGQGY